MSESLGKRVRRARDFYLFFRGAEYPNGRLVSFWMSLHYLRTRW